MTGNSTGDSTQYLVMTYMGKDSEKGARDIDNVYIYMVYNRFTLLHT